jgi:hypothetical protein
LSLKLQLTGGPRRRIDNNSSRRRKSATAAGNGSLSQGSFQTGQSLFKNFYSVVCHDVSPLIEENREDLDNGIGGLPKIATSASFGERVE